MTVVEPIRNIDTLCKIKETLIRKNYRDYVLFCLGINSGLRISDILKLNVEDVKNKEFLIISEQKTGKFKKIPINENLKAILQKFTAGRYPKEPLFVSKHNNRMNRIRAYEIIKQACAFVNLEANIGTHTLRKTFGYHHYRKFKDIAMLQKIFNHSNSDITLKYIGIEQDEIDFSYKNFLL